MTEAHAPPAPIVPHAWGGVDTTVDEETPELLSEEQFDRYVETVAELLRASGLTVDTHPSDPSQMRARMPGSPFSMEVDIRDDRSAEWSIDGAEETDPGTKAVTMAFTLARLLDPAMRTGEG